MYVGMRGTRRCMSGCGTRLGSNIPLTALALAAPVASAITNVKGALSSPPKQTANEGQAEQKGGFQNWLNSQSNTTLAIGTVAGLGLVLAVTR